MAGRSERFQLQGEVDPGDPEAQDINSLLDVKLIMRNKAIEEGDEKVFIDSQNYTEKQCTLVLEDIAVYSNNLGTVDEIEDSQEDHDKKDGDKAHHGLGDVFWEAFDRVHDGSESPFQPLQKFTLADVE